MKRWEDLRWSAKLAGNPQPYVDHVISELAMFGCRYLDRAIIEHTKEFMRQGCTEAIALCAAYTLCVYHGPEGICH